MKSKTKIIFLSIVFLAFLAVGFGKSSMVSAGLADNVVGWLWGGSQDGNTGASTGVGWISANNVDDTGTAVNGSVSYGLSIPSSDGYLSGYAWSSNLGWIDFGNTACPTGITGICNARRQGDYLAGYARVVAIKDALAQGNSGGWEGFIDLSGVQINDDDTLSGYGWNGEMIGTGSNVADGLGWISFSGLSIIPVKTLKVCTGCVSGTPPIAIGPTSGAISLYYGNSRDLKACFGASEDCGDTDVTGTATWPSSGTYTTLSGTNPKTVTAGNNEGTDNYSVSYTDSGNNYSADFSATVLCPPDDSCKYDACIGKTCTDICGNTHDGERDCGWKEVLP